MSESATERTPLLQDAAPDASGLTTRAPSITDAVPKNILSSDVEENTAQAVPTEPPVKPFRELLLAVRLLGQFYHSFAC